MIDSAPRSEVRRAVLEAVGKTSNDIRVYGSFADRTFHFDPHSRVILSDVDTHLNDGTAELRDRFELAAEIRARVKASLAIDLPVSVRLRYPFSPPVPTHANKLFNIAEAIYQSAAAGYGPFPAAIRFYHTLKLAIRLNMTSDRFLALETKKSLVVNVGPPLGLLNLMEPVHPSLGRLVLKDVLDNKVDASVLRNLSEMLSRELLGHPEIATDIAVKISKAFQINADAKYR